MRGRFSRGLAITAAALAALGIAACGSDDGSDAETTTAAAAPASSAVSEAAPTAMATSEAAPESSAASEPVEATSAASEPAPASSAAAEGFTFTDGSGKTVELDERPTRIIAHAYAAAALMEFGIKPIAVYADMPIKDDVGLRNVDFTGVEVIGEEWGKIDVEQAAALKPDLIVGDWWPVEKDYSGMEDGVEEKSKKIAELAPVVGAAQGDSIVDLIEGYEKLAEALGADVATGPAAEAKAEFEAARDAFTAAAEAKPGLTALAISPYDDQYAVAVPKYAPGAARLPALGPGRDRPEEARSRLPVLAVAELRERRSRTSPTCCCSTTATTPATWRRSRPSPSRRASRPSRRARTRRGRRTGCTPTPTTPQQLQELTTAIEKADPNIGS